MRASADKIQETRRYSVAAANEHSKKKSGVKTISRFADHRPEVVQPGVAQRVIITVAGWDDEDSEDAAAIKSLLEMVALGEVKLSESNKKAIREELQRGTYQKYESYEALAGLIKEHCKEAGSKEADDPQLAEEDAHAWRMIIGATVAQQIQFLQSVVDQTRQIVPVAINRAQERRRDSAADLTNNMFLCQQMLVKDFAAFMNRNGLQTDSNYIHPAALERIMILVKEAAVRVAASSGEALRQDDIQMAGLCKDYASIAYGLIKQNDPGNVLNAKLGFIKDHVFVEVTVAGQVYVIDAWRTAGRMGDGVIPKSAHLADLNRPGRQGATFAELGSKPAERETAEKNPKKHESLDDQYANYKKVYALLKSKEAEYKDRAIDFLAHNKEVYVGTGQF
ncbi:MAG TPA: hypothetical protein VFE32_14610 [Puia sp.]|jgi:hypothetical protein|nr:hypothetical protein [Puia sp.]